MDSPVARILQECGTTNKPFRERFGFSKGTLTYAIAGTFADLPGRLVDALFELAEEKNVDFRQIYREYGATTLDDAYHNWQSSERKRAAETITRVRPPFRSAPGKSPALVFVQKTYASTETFAKALKLPVATVYRWASGTGKGSPPVIIEALNEVGFEHTTELMVRQTAWAAKH